MVNLTTIEKGLEPERTGLEQVLVWLRDTFQVTDDASYQWAAEQTLAAKRRFKELEAERTAITGPLLIAKAGVDALFKPVTSALSAVEEALKEKIATFVRQREEERRAVMAASAAEYAAGGTPTAIIPAPAQVEGIAVRKVWDFEITDPRLVPRDLCKPDERLIRLCIQDGDREIPGVRIFQRDQVSARAKT
jgi:hypothetical protein